MDFREHVDLHSNTNQRNLKLVLDNLKAVFSGAIKTPISDLSQGPQNQIYFPKNFGNYTLFSHQNAIIAHMKQKENSFRTGKSIGGVQLYSRFGILGDAAGTGKTVAALAYMAQCKRSPSLRTSSYLHPQSQTNFFSIMNINNEIPTNLYIIPTTEIANMTRILENQNELRYLIIRKANQINDNLLQEFANLDLIVISGSQYHGFSEFASTHNLIFQRTFFENIHTLFVNLGQSSIHSQFTWLITHDWFNILYPDFSLYDYGNVLDNMIEDHYSNTGEDFINYINTQREQLINQTPSSRSLFNQFVSFHPLRHHLVLLTSNNYLQKSINPSSIQTKTINYDYDDRFSITYPVFSTIINGLITDEDYDSIIDCIGANRISKDEINAKCRDGTVDEDCPICCSTYNYPTLTNCCNNIFCLSCIVKHCTTSHTESCPFCRGIVNGTQLQTFAEPQPVQQGKYKMTALCEYINANKNAKILLYFPNQSRLGKLKAAFREAHIHYEILSGPRSANIKKMDKFNNNSNTNLLIVMDESVLTGYYLPSVTSFIFYPEITSARIKNFFYNRIHRLIREAPLTIVDFSIGGLADAETAGTAEAASGVINTNLGDV